MRWSRAARTPRRRRWRRVGCPMRRAAKGAPESMSWLVSMRIASRWALSRRCASSRITTRGGPRFGVVGGEGVGGLGDEGGGVEAGLLAERGDDVVEHAADPD